MRDPLVIASDLDRRSDILAGNSVADLLVEACVCIRWLYAQLKGKKRSTPQHRRFFALIDAAHKHWPSTHPVQAGTPEGLRAYLQIKAGFGKVNRIVDPDTGKDYIWFEHESVAHDKMGHNEFTVLAGKVEELIEKVIGVSADKLLEMDRNEI